MKNFGIPHGDTLKKLKKKKLFLEDRKASIMRKSASSLLVREFILKTNLFYDPTSKYVFKLI